MNIELKNIKKGDLFWESDSGNNAHLKALTDAYEVNEDRKNGWEVQVEALEINGKPAKGTPWHEPFTLFEAYESHGYGPKLYSEAAYVTFS